MMNDVYKYDMYIKYKMNKCIHIQLKYILIHSISIWYAFLFTYYHHLTMTHIFQLFTSSHLALGHAANSWGLSLAKGVMSCGWNIHPIPQHRPVEGRQKPYAQRLGAKKDVFFFGKELNYQLLLQNFWAGAPADFVGWNCLNWVTKGLSFCYRHWLNSKRTTNITYTQHVII